MSLCLATVTVPVAFSATAFGGQSVAAGGMSFRWKHRRGRIYGRLSAPGKGWLAVGFNGSDALRGTRFVIAAVSGLLPRAEVHIALVPDHQRIESLGGDGGLRDLSGGFAEGRSIVEFSLPHRAGDRYDVILAPGSKVHLMLAYSHSPDFHHHSAWRRHYEIRL